MNDLAQPPHDQDLFAFLNERFGRIESELANLVRLVAKTDLGEVLIKDEYTTDEVAKLSKIYGTKKAKPFTVRKAAADGRIIAHKNESGKYRIGRAEVLRILKEGIAPERK